MNCPKCGTANNPGAKFCKSCGTKLSDQTQQPSAANGAEKGFIDNLTHPLTYLQGGPNAVNAAVRREQQQRVRQEAERLGLNVTESANNSGENNRNTNQPQRNQAQRLSVDTDSIQGVEVVNGRAIWSIQKGELARRIKESEFANADGLKGVIIQEGCSALVYIDGKFVAAMEAGVYTFPSKTEAERLLESREKELEAEQERLDKENDRLIKEEKAKEEKESATFERRGVFGEIGAFGRGIVNFLFGKKKEETEEEHKTRTNKVKEKIKYVPSPKVCRVYIVSKRVINLVLAISENESGFEPYVIPTKLVDINVAVSLQAKLSNVIQFVTNYLADNESVRVVDIQKLVSPIVGSLLKNSLRNLDYQADGIPDPIKDNLKSKILLTLNDALHGIEVERVISITDDSADFDRFRAVERELFATAKELDFLQRTGEFRNRLECEQNKQEINHATNVESLRAALQTINKDKLISEDEMEEFVLLLNSQKRVREAKTQEEEYEALLGLKSNRLVKDDEYAALLNTLAQGKITRDNVTDIMRVQAMQKLEMAQQVAEYEISDSKRDHEMADELIRLQHQGKLMDHEMNVELLKIQHQGDLNAAKIENQKATDDYTDSRRAHEDEYAYAKRAREDNYTYNFDVRKEDRAWDVRRRTEDYEFEREGQQQDRDFENTVRKDDHTWKMVERERNAQNEQLKLKVELQEQIADNQHRRDKEDLQMKIEARDRAMAAMNAHELALKDKEIEALKEKDRSAEAIHAKDIEAQINKDIVEGNMSAEQLREKYRHLLSDSAQVASFDVESKNKINEFLEAQLAKEEERRKEDSDKEKLRLDAEIDRMRSMSADNAAMLERMMNKALETVSGVAATNATAQAAAYQQQYNNAQAMHDMEIRHQQERYDDIREVKEEYRDERHRMQDHTENMQNVALGNSTQVGTAVASNISGLNINQPSNKPAPLKKCPGCGAEIWDNSEFCMECGTRLK